MWSVHISIQCPFKGDESPNFGASNNISNSIKRVQIIALHMYIFTHIFNCVIFRNSLHSDPWPDDPLLVPLGLHVSVRSRPGQAGRGEGVLRTECVSLEISGDVCVPWRAVAAEWWSPASVGRRQRILSAFPGSKEWNVYSWAYQNRNSTNKSKL